ncbi:MAG: hypothetical protein AAFO77_06795, partial [Pseudomonadota bacterium]
MRLKMKAATAIVAMGLVLTHANAEGLAVDDLTSINAPATLAGNSFSPKAARERLTLACTDCSGFAAIDILLGSSNDGTEGRFRSGETTVQDMEDICRSRDEACRLERIDVGPAVGWLTIYSRGSTAVLLRDGDMLTARTASSGVSAKPRTV